MSGKVSNGGFNKTSSGGTATLVRFESNQHILLKQLGHSGPGQPTVCPGNTPLRVYIPVD